MPVRDVQIATEPKAALSSVPGREGFELILMRHGLAEEAAAAGEDARRALTPEGRKRVRQIARGLQRLGVDLDRIVTSPLVRAAETAEIVREAFSPAPPVERSDALVPGATPSQFIEFLSRKEGARRVLAVGHEPDLSVIAAHLIGAGPRAHLAFKKGGCCLIVFEETLRHLPGKLHWWLPPRVLRRVR